jgi:hypothetical protein
VAVCAHLFTGFLADNCGGEDRRESPTGLNRMGPRFTGSSRYQGRSRLSEDNSFRYGLTRRRHSSSAPPALIGLLLAVCTPRRLRVFSRRSMDAFNEKLCCGAACTILEGYDCDRPPPHGNVDWKYFERFVSVAEAQHRGWKHRHKLCARNKPTAQMN